MSFPFPQYSGLNIGSFDAPVKVLKAALFLRLSALPDKSRIVINGERYDMNISKPPQILCLNRHEIRALIGALQQAEEENQKCNVTLIKCSPCRPASFVVTPLLNGETIHDPDNSMIYDPSEGCCAECN